MKSILDPSFRYTSAAVHQDGSDYLRAKFKKLMKEHEQARAKIADEAAQIVRPIKGLR